MSEPWSVDRPRFFALAISAAPESNHEAYWLNGVERFEVSKDDSGHAGSFSFTISLANPYDPTDAVGFGNVNTYARVAFYNDLIAIYASRTSVNAQGEESDEPPLRPPSNLLNWGDANAATVKALGTSACVLIGMVDSVTEVVAPGGPCVLEVSGRDLTKIFYMNDIAMPDAAGAAALIAKQSLGGISGIAPTVSTFGQSNDFVLQSLSLANDKYGPSFLMEVLDLLVAKDLSSLSASGLTPAQIAAYKKFGFAWRNFVRTDGTHFDPKYLPLLVGSLTNYHPQMGSAWASVMELRNAPVNRIFVDELGRLVFDSSMAAWTQYDPVGAIPAAEIREMSVTLDDAAICTFISISPNPMAGSLNPALVLGYLQGSGFVGGLQGAVNISDAHIQTYGYRYAQFESMFDANSEMAQQKQAVLLESLNNVYSATLTVRGRPTYRVGQRYQVLWKTQRPQTTNQVWYVEAVSHRGDFGSDYVTTLRLRYATPPGANPAGATGLSAPGLTGGGV